MEKKRILCFRPMHDTEGKKDVTYAFKPECEAFMACMDNGDGHIEVIDNSRSLQARKVQVIKALDAADKEPDYFDAVAFFCHGWSAGIQLGFQNQDAKLLAQKIQMLCDNSDPVVPLYCCSTGDDKDPLTSLSSPGTGDNSFADRLRDALCGYGAPDCRVMGHTTVAHASKNPMALFFDGMGSPVGGAGGFEVVGPGSPLWGRWKKAMQSTDLRFRFTFMSVAEIHAELSA